MLEISLYLIPLLFGGVQLLELTAVLARISGVESGNKMLGYTLQQCVYMGTRFLLVLLMPLLGLAVDAGVESESFQIMAHASLLISAVFGVGVFVARAWIMKYYVEVIIQYRRSSNLFQAFFRSFFSRSGAHDFSIPAGGFGLLRDGEARRLLMLSCVVFTIYSVGVLASFYLALIFYEYRAAVSQLSGIVNAFGAVLLTFVVEPRISRKVDESSEHASLLIMAIFSGRLLALALTGQFVLFLIFLVG